MKKLTTRIVMRSGHEYTVAREFGDAAKQRIAQSTGSVFLNIPSLGAMINSADIVEVLDESEMVAQKDNLLAAGQMTAEDREEIQRIIKRTKEDLIARGVL